jgi:hypothetical protein
MVATVETGAWVGAIPEAVTRAAATPEAAVAGAGWDSKMRAMKTAKKRRNFLIPRII